MGKLMGLEEISAPNTGGQLLPSLLLGQHCLGKIRSLADTRDVAAAVSAILRSNIVLYMAGNRPVPRLGKGCGSNTARKRQIISIIWRSHRVEFRIQSRNNLLIHGAD